MRLRSLASSMQSALDALIKGASNQAYKTSVPEGSGFGLMRLIVETDGTIPEIDEFNPELIFISHRSAG